MKTFNVKLLYFYKFTSQCLPIYAFYTILFIEKGMSVSNIAVLLALWSLFTIVFEVPSGILADRWNRRNMLAIAAGLQGLCFIIWYVYHTFAMFALGFVFWAVSGAFISGTEEGLIYDNLKSDGCEEDFADIYGKTRFYENTGIIAGIVSAGMLSGFMRIETIALLSAVICFANALLVLQLREKNYYFDQLSEESRGFFKTSTEAFVFIKGSSIVLLSISFLVFFASLGDYMDEFDALIIYDLGLNNVWVSVILTVRFVFTALGGAVAPFIKDRVSSSRQLFLLYGLACIILAIFAIIWHPYAFTILGLAVMGMAVTEILFVTKLQEEIKEKGRATVMSFYGIGQNIVMIGFSLIFAWLSKLFTLQQVYLLLSFYGLLGGLSFYLFMKR